MNQRFGFCHDCKNKDHCRQCYRGSWYENGAQSCSDSEDNWILSKNQENKETIKQTNKKTYLFDCCVSCFLVCFLSMFKTIHLFFNISNNISNHVQNNKKSHKIACKTRKFSINAQIKQELFATYLNFIYICGAFVRLIDWNWTFKLYTSWKRD